MPNYYSKNSLKNKLFLVIIAVTLFSLWNKWQEPEPVIATGIERAGDRVISSGGENVTLVVGSGQPTSIYTDNSPIIKAARKVGKTVVTIRTTYNMTVSNPFGRDELFENFYRDFFGGVPQPREERRSALGSGVIISPDGSILTNEHVIHNADEILVKLANGDEYQATVTAKDVDSDIALLKIDGKDLPFAEIGDSDRLEIGGWVIAIGNPFGFAVNDPHPTVTVGVVSAKNRSLDAGNNPRRHYTNLIQTDAAINPGNSGGPLVDLDGKVVGINSAIYSTSGGYQGIGFAIAINSAMKVKGDLLEFGRVIKPMLGIVLQPIETKWKEYYDLPDSKGALVVRVIDDSPADQAGIKKGDIIKAVNGKEIIDANELVRFIQRQKVGDVVELTLLRMGGVLRKHKTIKVKVVLREARDVYQESAQIENSFGIRAADITPELAGRYGLNAKEGVVVTGVEQGSPAARLGLKAGDVIREVNRKPVTRLEVFNKIISGLKKGDMVNFVIIRGDTMYLFRFAWSKE